MGSTVELANSESDQLDFLVLLTEWFGTGWVLPSLILAFLLWVAYAVGDAEAQNQKRFLTLKSSPDIVILRNYDELFIATRFDRTSKQISEDLILIPINKNSHSEFKNEFIGPLTMKIPSSSPKKTPLHSVPTISPVKPKVSENPADLTKKESSNVSQ